MANASTYTDAEWGLLVGLPQSVLVAASSVESDGTRRTLAEGAAGMTAIAAGAESPHALVRDVAKAVVERVGGTEEGAELSLIELPSAAVPDVLDRARATAALLAAKAPADEATAYKHWLVTIAEEVAGAARSGGVLGIGGEWVSEAERGFLHELTVALGD
ncbi:MAG TPA: hypothetical protein VF054_04590 [Micromonosporaceae bacterium]